MVDLRNKFGIPLLAAWCFIYSINLGFIDKIGHNIPSLFFYRSGYVILPALLLFIKKPMWMRTLLGMVCCGIIAGVTLLLSPKVPYDAPASIWLMVFFIAYGAGILILFALYSIVEFITARFYRTKTETPPLKVQLFTFIVFIMACLLIAIAFPASRHVVIDKATVLMRGKGYIFDLGFYKLKTPSFFVRGYDRSKFDKTDRKEVRDKVIGGELIYSVASVALNEHLDRARFKNDLEYPKNVLLNYYQNDFSRDSNIKRYKIDDYICKIYPKLAKIQYEYIFAIDNKQYLKKGIVIFAHPRIYADINVSGTSLNSGLIDKKLQEFFNSIEINGEIKYE